MEIVKSQADINQLHFNKILVGEGLDTLILEDSSIEFKGNNNILYCDKNVVLKNSNLKFNGSNSLIYLGANKHPYIIDIYAEHDTVFHMGINNFINGAFNKKMIVMLSEQKHCFIGDFCVISFGLFIRNADPHLIYDCKTLKRINPTKSVFLGDHIWLGQDCTILKGTQIDSGSIIGANSVVAGKIIPHNTAWAGNPCRKIKDDIFWDRNSVHCWKYEMTSDSQDYSNFVYKHMPGCTLDNWIYNFDPANCIEFEEIDKYLSDVQSSEEKLDILIKLNKNKNKNRFVHNW